MIGTIIIILTTIMVIMMLIISWSQYDITVVRSRHFQKQENTLSALHRTIQTTQFK